MTHARLRVAQGDTAGARAVLRAVLLGNPRDLTASRMLAELDGVRSTGHDEPAEAPLAPAHPAEAAALGSAFRAALGRRSSGTAAARLEKWSRAIARKRGERRDAR